MHRMTMNRRPPRPRGLPVRWQCLALLVSLGSVCNAADIPPELVAEFTRRVQPLILNRCAAGACHGGTESPAPRFARQAPRGGIDRRSTLANLQQFLEAVGPDRETGKLASLLAVQHPAVPASPRLVAAPLSPRERTTLDTWLTSVRIAEHRIKDPAVQQVSAVAEVPQSVAPAAAPPPNRFKALLDSAANPPQFPPPQEPQSVIFPNDTPPVDE